MAKLLRPEYKYFSLEDPDIREFATNDPRGFLAQTEGGTILDEVQRAPELFSYLQGVVDAGRETGRYILTGSSQFQLIESITQSLAGRTALLTLLPFSLTELQNTEKAPESVDELLYRGLFPPIYDRNIPANVWLQNYVATYLERDVREILNVVDMAAFQRFVQLCAGRCGQLLNVSSLANDAGITRVTAQSWLTVLQASHLIFLVSPWSRNISKRVIKSPKLYFCDPGLAAWLIGVREEGHLTSHPQRGALFENWVMTELLKAQCHAGEKPGLYFLRNKQGNEIDAVIEHGLDQIHAVEVKSGATINPDFFSGLNYWQNQLTHTKLHPWVVYAGKDEQKRSQGRVLPWTNLSPLLDQLAI